MYFVFQRIHYASWLQRGRLLGHTYPHGWCVQHLFLEEIDMSYCDSASIPISRVYAETTLPSQRVSLRPPDDGADGENAVVIRRSYCFLPLHEK